MLIFYKTIFFSLLILPQSAFAYLGPGMGGGFFTAAIGIIVAIFAAIFGVIWFPLKRVFKNKKNKKNKSA